ncbi:MAG: proton-conducting transporter membrane subunit, partial [Pseudomonadota bacterium]
HQTGGITFGAIADIDIATMEQTSLAAWLILIAVGIKCAFPLLHAWLPDAYPEATVSGTVWLSAFTTKLAIYTLARGFPGSDILIVIGAVATIYPLIYAILEDDLRRVLCHALNNQLGFMVIGVGVGSGFAIAAVTAQAFGSVLYKALLFMSIGVVLYRTNTARVSELGGLAKSMPWTASFAIIGALAMSTPLFIGYVGKGLLSAAVAEDGALITWVILTLTSAGVFLVVALRLVMAAFFGEDRNLQPEDAPGHMKIAMGGAALACIVFGAAPWLLYDMLPAPITYDVYKPSSVVTQFQLIVFTALVFVVFSLWGWLPKPRRATLLNADWFYRKLGYNIGSTLLLMMRDLVRGVGRAGKAATLTIERNISRTHNPDGILGRTWATGTMAFVATAMLAAYLLIFYARALATG